MRRRWQIRAESSSRLMYVNAQLHNVSIITAACKQDRCAFVGYVSIDWCQCSCAAFVSSSALVCIMYESESGAHVLKLLPLLPSVGWYALIWGMSLVGWEISANQSMRSVVGEGRVEDTVGGDGAGWGCGYGGGESSVFENECATCTFVGRESGHHFGVRQ